MIAWNGFIETEEGRVGIQSVCLEEDSARIVNREEGIFKLDRLGVPLVEIATDPDIKNPEQARVRLFDSITNFLERASKSRPLVLILDNLYWADRPSLLLLEFLAQEFANGQMLVVGTYRNEELSAEHPLTRVLGELTKIQNFQRLPLKGLSHEDVGELIQLIAGATPVQALVDSVFSHTQGNPLFVTEVVRLLVQDPQLTQGGQLEMVSGDLGIPDGVREAIGGRLIRLSGGCNRVLTTA